MVVALLLLNSLVFLLTAGLSETAGAVPFEITHLVDVGARDILPPPFTVLSSMFVHATAAHLAGNMLMLAVFGGAVEKALGARRFLAFYLLAGIAAAAMHCLFNADSTAPMVGASGAIAGVMGAHMVLRPKAALFLIPWFAVQFPGVGPALGLGAAASDVAWLAHVGGFVAGAVFALGADRRPVRAPSFATA